MGTIGDRIGFRTANVFALILLAATLSWLLVANEVWMLYLFAVIYGFAQGGSASIGTPLIAELFGLGALGTLVGTTSIAGWIGGALGPFLAGYLYDVSSNYQLAFQLLAIAAFVALVLALLLKPISLKGGDNDQRRSA